LPSFCCGVNEEIFFDTHLMNLKEIYRRAKKINPLYRHVSFADFISDFGNYREGFFVSYKEYKKLNTKKLDEEFGKYYTKYYR
tara:strand:+ start:696 stop:944 length:249 start_codon:yes stop_codon:yes gene_type:complete